MTLYEYYNTGDDGGAYVRSSQWYAQTFTIGTVGPNKNHNITSVKLKLYRSGSPGTFTVGIRETDANGHPTGSDLTSGTIDGDSLTTDTNGAWYEISLTPYELTAGTKYAIVARAPSGSSSKYVSWRVDSTNPSYTGGNMEYSNDSGSSWSTDTSRDLMFEEYGEEISVAFMKPTKVW